MTHTIPFGSDPLEAFGVTFRIRNCPFRESELYLSTAMRILNERLFGIMVRCPVFYASQTTNSCWPFSQ